MQIPADNRTWHYNHVSVPVWLREALIFAKNKKLSYDHLAEEEQLSRGRHAPMDRSDPAAPRPGRSSPTDPRTTPVLSPPRFLSFLRGRPGLQTKANPPHTSSRFTSRSLAAEVARVRVRRSAPRPPWTPPRSWAPPPPPTRPPRGSTGWAPPSSASATMAASSSPPTPGPAPVRSAHPRSAPGACGFPIDVAVRFRLEMRRRRVILLVDRGET